MTVGRAPAFSRREQRWVRRAFGFGGFHPANAVSSILSALAARFAPFRIRIFGVVTEAGDEGVANCARGGRAPQNFHLSGVFPVNGRRDAVPLIALFALKYFETRAARIKIMAVRVAIGTCGFKQPKHPRPRRRFP